VTARLPRFIVSASDGATPITRLRWRRRAQIPAATNLCQRGFTLIELLVVMSLIIILSAMALVQYRQSVIRSREAVLKDDLFKMRDAIDQYYADKNQYPATLTALATDGYLRAIPKDPFTDSETTWREIPAEPDPSRPIAEPGVYDVKSGSDATALDGTLYSDW
jgi:general secretion pathway protein G